MACFRESCLSLTAVKKKKKKRSSGQHGTQEKTLTAYFHVPICKMLISLGVGMGLCNHSAKWLHLLPWSITNEVIESVSNISELVGFGSWFRNLHFRLVFLENGKATSWSMASEKVDATFLLYNSPGIQSCTKSLDYPKKPFCSLSEQFYFLYGNSF